MQKQLTPIAKNHARIRALMSSCADFSVSRVIDEVTANTLRMLPEDAADALLQVDLAVPLLDSAREDMCGADREAADRALLGLAAAATALARHAGWPLQNDGTLSDLHTFVCFAESRYLATSA